MRVVPLKWDERTAGRTNGWDLKDLEFFLLLLLWTNELIVQLLRIIMKQRTFAPKLCSSSPPFLPRNLSRCGKYSAPYTTLFVALVISSSFIQRRRMVGNCFSMRNSESKDLLIFLNGCKFFMARPSAAEQTAAGKVGCERWWCLWIHLQGKNRMGASLYGENSEANQQRIGIYITSCVGGQDGGKNYSDAIFSRNFRIKLWRLFPEK